MGKINIFLNDESISLETPVSLNELISRLGLPLFEYVCAVNNKVLSRGQWTSYQLDEGDNIAFFQAIAGG